MFQFSFISLIMFVVFISSSLHIKFRVSLAIFLLFEKFTAAEKHETPNSFSIVRHLFPQFWLFLKYFLCLCKNFAEMYISMGAFISGLIQSMCDFSIYVCLFFNSEKMFTIFLIIALVSFLLRFCVLTYYYSLQIFRA